MPKVSAANTPIAFTPRPTATAALVVVVAGLVGVDVCTATSALIIVAEITVVIVTTLVALAPLTVSVTVSVVVVQPVVCSPFAVTVK